MITARKFLFSLMLFAATASIQASTLPGVLAVGPQGESWQAIVSKSTPVLYKSLANASGYAEAMGIYMDNGVVVNVYIHPGKDTLNSAQVRDYFYKELYADNADLTDFEKSVAGRRGLMNFWAYTNKGVTVNQFFHTVSMSRGSWRIHFEIFKTNMHSDDRNFLTSVVESCGVQDTPKGVAVEQDLALEALGFWTSKVDSQYRLLLSKKGGTPSIVVKDNATNKPVVETTKYTQATPGAGALSDKLNSLHGVSNAQTQILGKTEFVWTRVGNVYKVICTNGTHEMYLDVHAENDDSFKKLLNSLAGN